VRRLLISLTIGLAMVGMTSAGSFASARPATSSHSSVARFAAGATPFQNKVIDKIMTQIPGGTRVSAGKVEWDGHGITLTVPPELKPSAGRPDATPSCPDYTFCAWSEPDYNPTACSVAASSGNFYQWFNWGAYSADGCNSAGTWSWDNHTQFQVYKFQKHTGGIQSPGGYFYHDGTGSGSRWCIGSFDKNPDVSDTQSREDAWIWVTGIKEGC
jgi:hypothetical protein